MTSEDDVYDNKLYKFLPGKTYAAVFLGSFDFEIEQIPDEEFPSSLRLTNPDYYYISSDYPLYEAEYYFDNDAENININSTINGKNDNVYSSISTIYPYIMTIAIFETPPANQILKATINWENTEEENMPESLILKLTANNKVIKEQAITKLNAINTNTWEFDFGEYPIYDDDLNKITYTLSYAASNEDDLKNFETDVKGWVITNRYVPEEKEIESPIIKASNPKTGDEHLQKYLSLTLTGIASILIAFSILRKYSTKKSKVQF